MLDLVAKIIIIAVVVIVGTWDVFVVLIMGKPEATISAVLLQLTKENPIIAFMLGVVVGHLFWPNFRG